MNFDYIDNKIRANHRLLARIDERERNSQVSVMADQMPVPLIRAGNNQAPADQGRNRSVDTCATPRSNALAPTEAERAVDKVLAKHLVEFFRLQHAANGIAVKESK